MNTKEVSSYIRRIDSLFNKLKEFKQEIEHKNANIEMDFFISQKELEEKKEKLLKEKTEHLKNESFIKKAVYVAKAEYNKVLFYFGALFFVSIMLTVLNFYINGINFHLYTMILLMIMAGSFYALKTLKEHIESLNRIDRLSDTSIPPPFFYKWFKKPTIHEIAIEMSQKYISNINIKYDKLIFDFEKEYNSMHQNIFSEKQREMQNVTFLEKTFLKDIKEELSSLQNELEKIQQTCSSITRIIDNDSKMKLPQNSNSQQFIFSHYERIECNDQMICFPKYIPFGNNMNLHIEKAGNEIIKIKSIIKDIVFRNLTGIMFSKIKIIMYDPVELGGFFSELHGLNKEITDGFIYNNPNELNEILDSTLRQIAMIVQKILTNKYSTLDDFNEHNPELAEPYKILIFNDFPKSFSDSEIEKIKQVISSGPKCGVYTIVIGKINNFGFDPMTSLNTLDYTPIFNDADIDTLIGIINKGTRDAGSLIVNLNAILTNENSWWTNDSSTLLDIPIGKRGKEIQSLKFDNKDDNQALMIGKPGSGKSNLLHVIILSAITKYSPTEIEIYLIDFKGGVEFISYAEFNIPQLRTVALESDREFGLSVIDGVEKELLRRETLFRNGNVQNIEQFNLKFPEQKIPRILFIVDEFQEFFKIEDDLKEQVTLKYDTIIRKGRAFGINSLFSSQTLEGHSMPRATKELIDIRIALMCGLNDVREIMDDKNLSAKDLSRPGEAIYNAENGKSNGNQRFQAVFVEKEEIHNIIKKISEMPIKGNDIKERFIFRGDTLASINKVNHDSNDPEMLKFKSLRLWIGEPVSMNPDFFIDISQNSAQNLIAFGNNKDVAGVFSSIIYSSKKQEKKIESIFVINPLTDIDDAYEEFKNAYGSETDISLYDPSELEQLLNDIHEILERRKTRNDPQKIIICCLNSINKLSKFREDNLYNIGDKLNSLLREGSEFGVHFIIHCDSFFNFKRTSLNNCLSLFDHRIVFAMNQDAYYEIINSYQIKNLKSNRMIYYNNELGKNQIIKPYQSINNN